MPHLTLITALCIGAAAACSGQQPEHAAASGNSVSPPGSGYVRISLEWIKESSGHVFRSKVGGQNVVWFVDTGATNTSIDTKTSERLKLALGAPGVVTGFYVERLPVRQADLPDFMAGELIRPYSMPVVVMDMEKVANHMELKAGVRFDGILGGNFLKAYEAVIDYRTDTLWVKPPPIGWDYKLFQGRWRCVGMEMEGEAVRDAKYVAAFTLAVEGRDFRFGPPSTVNTGELQLNPETSPKRLCIKGAAVNGKSINDNIVGLYEATDDRIRLLLPLRRGINLERLPTEFKSTKENGVAVFTFARPAPEKPAPVGRREAAEADRNWFDCVPVANLIRRCFPNLAGPWQIGPTACTLNRDLSLTATLNQGGTRITFRADGSLVVDNGSGTTLTVHPAPKPK